MSISQDAAWHKHIVIYYNGDYETRGQIGGGSLWTTDLKSVWNGSGYDYQFFLRYYGPGATAPATWTIHKYSYLGDLSEGDEIDPAFEWDATESDASIVYPLDYNAVEYEQGKWCVPFQASGTSFALPQIVQTNPNVATLNYTALDSLSIRTESEEISPGHYKNHYYIDKIVTKSVVYALTYDPKSAFTPRLVKVEEGNAYGDVGVHSDRPYTYRREIYEYYGKFNVGAVGAPFTVLKHWGFNNAQRVQIQ